MSEFYNNLIPVALFVIIVALILRIIFDKDFLHILSRLVGNLTKDSKRNTKAINRYSHVDPAIQHSAEKQGSSPYSYSPGIASTKEYDGNVAETLLYDKNQPEKLLGVAAILYEEQTQYGKPKDNKMLDVPKNDDEISKIKKQIRSNSIAIGIDNDRVMIGRDPRFSSIVIADSYVSPLHAVIRHNRGVFEIIDAGSHNGVVVNYVPQVRCNLKHDDIIILGKTRFLFKVIN